jgi:hypothetical protein
MIDAGDAVVLEDRVGLRIFLGKRIGADAVVLEEGLDLHEFGVRNSECGMKAAVSGQLSAVSKQPKIGKAEC